MYSPERIFLLKKPQKSQECVLIIAIAAILFLRTFEGQIFKFEYFCELKGIFSFFVVVML